MGWNTWNHFGCDISEDTILSAAEAMVKANLTQFGYECELPINIPRWSAFTDTSDRCCHG